MRTLCNKSRVFTPTERRRYNSIEAPIEARLGWALIKRPGWLWTVSTILARSRRLPENVDRRAHCDCVEERDRALFRHPDAPVRGRITREIPGVHSDRVVKAHKVAHRRSEKFSAARHRHVGIGVGHDRAAVPIDDLTVERREMVSLFLDDLEGTGLRQVT